jgi:hypothetical protein
MVTPFVRSIQWLNGRHFGPEAVTNCICFGSNAAFDGDGRPDLVALDFDGSFDHQRTGDVVVLLGNRSGTFRLPLERIAVERAVSRVASDAVNGVRRAETIVSHRESGCVTLLRAATLLASTAGSIHAGACARRIDIEAIKAARRG